MTNDRHSFLNKRTPFLFQVKETQKKFFDFNLTIKLLEALLSLRPFEIMPRYNVMTVESGKRQEK